MTKKGRLVLLATLMLVCGAPAATAQSYGATGPARAETTDPNSASTRGFRQSGITPQSRIYARGHRYDRVSARRAGPAPAAPQADKTGEANRNTAMLMTHAMNPWAASQPGTPPRATRRARR